MSLLLHPREHTREYYDLMDILPDLRYLNQISSFNSFLFIDIQLLPTPVIITGRIRDTEKTNAAISRREKRV